MPNLIRRRKSKKERALRAAGDAAKKVAEARLAWAGGRTAVKVAAPAVLVGALAAIARRRSGAAPA